MLSYIDCQDCGVRVYGPLTEQEKQRVADAPYNFVVYCLACQRETVGL